MHSFKKVINMAARRRGLTPEEILQRLQDISEDESEREAGEEYESCDEIDTIHDYDSFSSEEEDSSDVITDYSSLQTSNQLFGKDGTVWNEITTNTRSLCKTPSQNVLKVIPGATYYARRHISENPDSSWRLLIDKVMLQNIQNCTQTEARLKTENLEWSVSLLEIEAFIAIMYLRGVYRFTDIRLEFLWNRKYGPPIFSKIMSKNRFQEIMKYFRFDVRSTRSARLKEDKFALVSSIWNRFVYNCIQCYKPGEFLTVDEQLFPSKTRCPFTQYIPSKPDKFGIKFWVLADVNSKYFCNGFPYIGKDEQRPPNQSLPEYVVMKLMEPFFNQGRNVTTDNFFTTLNLANRLKQKGTSIVGTVNRIRREVPEEVRHSNEKLYDSKFLQTSDSATLTVYQGKKKKNVLVLSTLHSNAIHVKENEKKTPETVEFYNSTKFGVDILDQMLRKYTTRAATRRWPIHVFYNILDLAGINAWILYKEESRKNISRHEFLIQLAEELGRCTEDPSACGLPEAEISSSKRKKCQILLGCKGNKTYQYCSSCKKSVCGKCGLEQKTMTCVKCKK